MTFDDGVLDICAVKNLAEPGERPVVGLVEKESFFYGFDNLGINRYYTAMQNNQQIECVVNIPGWNDIEATDICVLESGKQYRIAMMQPMHDENGIRITKLSLERINEEYVFENQTD